MMKFGLLMPHFGEEAGPTKLLRGAELAETYGFDSLWVRDHLVFEPHGELEKPNAAFYEALTSLTAIGAVTDRIQLGTGSLIPFRHPLHTALTVATMTQMFGPRVILGFGAGTFDHEFEAIGMGHADRVELVRSNAAILKRVFSERDVDYEDENYRFSGVNVDPKPPGPVPFYYCGGTPRSARLAVEFCDGWMPGRITLKTIGERIAAMSALVESSGRSLPVVGVIPPTSIAGDHDRALDDLNIGGLLKWANERGKWWVKPPSGRFETAEDLEGSLIAGSPDEVIAEVRKFQAVGVDHLVFDLRLRFDRWFESIELLGAHVLPELRGV